MQKGIAPILIVVVLIIITLLPQAAEKKSAQSSYELLQTKNRTKALQEARLAATLWPFDNKYKTRLSEIEKIYNRAAIIIYFQSAKQADIQQLETEILSVNDVKDVKYISQDEALKMYKELNKNDPALIKMVTKDILPDSLEVYLNNFTVREKVEQIAKKKSFVSTVLQSI